MYDATKMTPLLNWEHDKAKWFKIEDVLSGKVDIHFGVKFSIDNFKFPPPFLKEWKD